MARRGASGEADGRPAVLDDAGPSATEQLLALLEKGEQQASVDVCSAWVADVEGRRTSRLPSFLAYRAGAAKGLQRVGRTLAARQADEGGPPQVGRGRDSAWTIGAGRSQAGSVLKDRGSGMRRRQATRACRARTSCKADNIGEADEGRSGHPGLAVATLLVPPTSINNARPARLIPEFPLMSVLARARDFEPSKPPLEECGPPQALAPPTSG